MKNSLIILIILSIGITNLNAQNKMNTSTIYIHDEPVSFRSKAVQRMSSLLGVKKVIENRLNSGDYKTDAAPIPKSIKKAIQVEYDTIRNSPVWTLKPKLQRSGRPASSSTRFARAGSRSRRITFR